MANFSYRFDDHGILKKWPIFRKIGDHEIAITQFSSKLAIFSIQNNTNKAWCTICKDIITFAYIWHAVLFKDTLTVI